MSICLSSERPVKIEKFKAFLAFNLIQEALQLVPATEDFVEFVVSETD